MIKTFLIDYFKALEKQGYVKSKRIGLIKIYFNKKIIKGEQK
jgi:hypothetical protein